MTATKNRSIHVGDRVEFTLVPGEVGIVAAKRTESDQGPWEWTVEFPAKNEAGYAPYPAFEDELTVVETEDYVAIERGRDIIVHRLSCHHARSIYRMAPPRHELGGRELLDDVMAYGCRVCKPEKA